MRFFKKLSLIIGGIGISFFGLANTILEISNEFDCQYVGEYLGIYEDKAGTTSIVDILQKENWQTQNAPIFSSKTLFEHLWIKLQLKNQTNQYQELSLVVEDPLLEKIQFYSFEEERLLDTSLQMGINYPFSQRAVKHRFPIYTFQLAPYQETTIYGALVENRDYTKVHFKLYKQAYLVAGLQKDLIVKMLLLSPLLLITFISFLFFLSFQGKSSLFLTLYYVNLSLFLVGLEGIGFQYLWPNGVQLQKAFPIFYSLCSSFLALSLLSFFKMDKKTMAAKLLSGVIWFQLFFLIYVLFTVFAEQLFDIELLKQSGQIIMLLFSCSFLVITLACLNYYNRSNDKIMLSIVRLFGVQLLAGIFMVITWLLDIYFQKHISFFILITGTALLQIVGVFLIIFSYYKNRTTEFEEVELQLSQKKNEALQNLLKGQENERKRLSRALHDGLSIRMLQVKQGLDMIKGELNTNRFTPIIQDIDQIHQDIRNLSHALNPTVLQEFGLKKAINDIIFNIELNNPELDIQFEYPLNFPINKEQEKHFYYIIQELLNNSVKYAESNYICIEFKVLRDRLMLYYFDNGKGYDPNNLLSTGIGLNNIQSRIALLNGKFKIIPRKPNGIEHTIYIPYLQNS